MGKITEYGYVRDTLQDITTKLRADVKTKMGQEWVSETGKVLDQFLSIFAEQLDQVEQGIEGVVESQKVTGAEGVYLDDILNRQGVYRQGKSKGSGEAIIFANNTFVGVGYTIPLTTTVTATNNIVYNITETNTYDNYINCYKLRANAASVGVKYTFSIYNSNKPSSRVFEWTPTSDTDRDTMLRNLAQYINDNVQDKPSSAYYNSADRTLYLGFNPATNLPLPYANGDLYVSVIPRIGDLGVKVKLEANTAGYYPLAVGGLVSVSPVFGGWTSPVQNWVDFDSGREVQTDSEFLLNANKQKQNSLAGTEDALINSLLDLEGVFDVRIYQNPTTAFLYDSANRTVCQPFTYNCVVVGGNDDAIARTIHQKGYGNTKTFGTRTVITDNVKGEPVNVKFSKATYFDVAVNVKVTTRDGTALNETEKANISNNLIAIISDIEVGGSVSVDMLKSTVLQSVGFGRIRQVAIKLMDLTLPNPDFTDNDLQAEYDEKPRLSLQFITYGRI
jgi:uncharacterized phage protein gp47/JayE